MPFANAAAFLERYDDIFNPMLRDGIARAAVSQGSVVGTNDVVIAEVNGQIRITSIAVPHYAGDITAHVEPAERSRTVRRQEPRRVAIRVGPRATQIPGLLGRDATDVLLLYLPKGKLAGSDWSACLRARSFCELCMRALVHHWAPGHPRMGGMCPGVRQKAPTTA